MSEWREVAVQDLCSRVTSGGTPSRKRADFYGQDGIPWVKSQELVEAQINATEENITEAGLKGSSAKLLPPGTVLMAMYGANVGQLGWLGIEATVNQAICAMMTDPEVTDPRFLYYALAGARASLIAKAHGAAQQNLSQQLIKPFKLAVPNLVTQRLIGGILRSIDDLIANNRRRVKVLDEMARAIYREWFVNFRYPSHKDVPLVHSAVGLIPGGWTVQPFAEIASFVNGFAFKPSHWGSEGRPIIKIKELKQGVVGGTPRRPAEWIAEKYWVERGDLLFSWSADLGVYLWNDEPGLLNQHLFTVRPALPSLTIPFLFHALDEAMPQFRSRAQGTTMRHIKRSALSEVQTSIPGEELLERFTQTVRPMHDESARLRREATLLETLRDLLLPKLVTGQVDVSTLDLDAVVSTGSTAGVRVA